MEFSHLLALLIFAFISSLSPGPNNIMLMTSGANIGFYKTIPHILGIIAGYSVMLLLIGLGLMPLFQQYPLIQNTLQILCLLYLLFLAYKIATSNVLNSNKKQFKAMSFLAAAGFQWLNPKGWSMALSAMTLYGSELNYAMAIAVITGVFAVVNIPSACIWTIAGQKSQRLLADPKRLKVFNYSMASLLVTSVGFSF